MSKIEKTLEEIAEKICAPMGISVYDVEYVKEGGDYFLRLYIDKAGGVDLDDCERVSVAINPELDRRDFVGDRYIFEVSSPGIERKLRRDGHFEQALGRMVEVRLFAPVNGQKQLTGELSGYENGVVSLKIGDETVRIEKDKAASVKLHAGF